MRTQDDVDRVVALLRTGSTPTEVAGLTGIPRSTIRDWGEGRGLDARRDPDRREPCPCGHARSETSASEYSYLLGLYLGDGHISGYPRGVWRLRITLDSAYPAIIAACAEAITAVRGKTPAVHVRSRAQCVDVSSYWKHWLCVIPQHGPGRKDTRRIALRDWQSRIVEEYPEEFIRGLIHSDGFRFVATERKGINVRRVVRYGFSNRSEDIHRLFADTCALVGVRCTRASAKQTAIYRKASVALLDEFVGPKA